MAVVASGCVVGFGGDDDEQAESSTQISTEAVQDDEDEDDDETTTTVAADDDSTDDGTDDGTDNDDDDEEALDPAAVKAFCGASAEYWVASNAANHINLSRPAQVRQTFGLMEETLDEAIALAPDDELAALPLLARDNFDAVHAELAGFQYDWDTFLNSNVYATNLEARLDTLGDIEDQLDGYLAGPCELSLDTLGDEAIATASGIAAADTGEGQDPDDGDDPGGPDVRDGYVEVFDSTDRLRVTVPEAWSDTQSEPSGNGSAITIAPDVSTYLTSWAIDGMKMSVAEAGVPADWRGPMAETNAASECVLVSSEEYRDPLYLGWIERYEDCPGGSTAVVIGATDEDLSVEILVEVQFDTENTGDDDEVLQEILDTFQAR